MRATEAQAHAIKKQTAEFMAEQMRLALSPEKTAITHVDDGFELLGFRIKRAPWRANKRVAYTFPRQRALREIMHRIKTLTDRSTVNLSPRPPQPLPVVAGDPLAAQGVPRLTWKQIRRRCCGTTGPGAKARGSPGPTRSR